MKRKLFNIENISERTLIHFCMESDDTALLLRLLDILGRDVNIIVDGGSLLQHAIQNSAWNIAESLMKYPLFERKISREDALSHIEKKMLDIQESKRKQQQQGAHRKEKNGLESNCNMFIKAMAINGNSLLGDGSTLLIRAAEQCFVDTFESLLNDPEVDANLRDANNRHVLTVEDLDTRLLRIIKDSGKVDVNSQDKDGKTPIMTLIEEGRFESVQTIIAAFPQFDSNVKDNNGMTAFDYVRSYGSKVEIPPNSTLKRAIAILARKEDKKLGRKRPGVKASVQPSKQTPEPASDKVDPDLSYKMALKHERENNFEEAAKHYKAAADKGHSKAQCNYGCFLEDGKGVSQSFTEAVRYYKMSADQGNTTGMCNYGCCLETGKGIEKNLDEAIKYYKLSAGKGNKYGKMNLERLQIRE